MDIKFFFAVKKRPQGRLAKDSQLIYNGKTEYFRMRKNSAEDKRPIEVDTVSGEYYVRIPEWVVNDQGWFEDTEVGFKTDGDELIITEHNN